jgi:hypothetical protein
MYEFEKDDYIQGMMYNGTKRRRKKKDQKGNKIEWKIFDKQRRKLSIIF